jgi:hypothetical protein
VYGAMPDMPHIYNYLQTLYLILLLNLNTSIDEQSIKNLRR